MKSLEVEIIGQQLSEEERILGIRPETLQDGSGAEIIIEEGSNLPSDPMRPIQHRNELIYKLMATGMKGTEICAELGISANSFYIASNKPEANSRVHYYRERLFGHNVRKKMDALAHKAVDKLEKLLDSDIEKVQADAVYYVLDQNVGKAKNTIQHEGSLLSEMIDRINSAREVKEIAEEHKAPKDDLESLIDDLIPSHTVGVRNREKQS